LRRLLLKRPIDYEQRGKTLLHYWADARSVWRSKGNGKGSVDDTSAIKFSPKSGRVEWQMEVNAEMAEIVGFPARPMIINSQNALQPA
jgi:hypothetical protein